MSVFYLLTLLSAFLVTNPSYSTTLPSSCADLSDGEYWMKLLPGDEYPAVNIICNRGFMIINIHKDPQLISYFTAYKKWHYAIAGPPAQDGVNWEQWWKPNALSTTPTTDTHSFHYSVAADCATCDSSQVEEIDYLEEGHIAYYMTGTIFLCLSTHKALRDCVWDWNSYECQYCSSQFSDADLGYAILSDPVERAKKRLIRDEQKSRGIVTYWENYQIGLCGVMPFASNTDMVPQTRDECLTARVNVLPSIGDDGRHCQCVQPTANVGFDISAAKLKEYKDAYNSAHTKNTEKLTAIETENGDKIYKLYKTDFSMGTYRITKPGTYLIMEDITFDFLAGSMENPNDGKYSWWPISAQSDEYPGAYKTRGPYFMGFFAGITVETANVIIDLQGYTLRMSDAFYYQQRIFSIISLKSVIFNLNNGPGMFGAEPKFASNVIIRNGVIGLSSHHGIHGHKNQHVLIENLHVKHFETHGIQLSDFRDVIVRNVEIGPCSDKAYLSGEYAYARFTLQKLERIRDTPSIFDDTYLPITFANRKESYSIQDIIDRLRTRMDMAFKYVMGNGKIHNKADDDYEVWLEAKKLFINEDGVPYGAVMYGLFLNLYVANVFGIHPSIKHSQQAIIENVIIHDLVHHTKEYIRLDKYASARYKNPYDASFDARSLLGSDVIELGYNNIDWTTVQYKGDVLIDAHIAIELITEDWDEKNLLFVDKEFALWALGYHHWKRVTHSGKDAHPWLGCNGDRMSHLAKGLMGIRADGVENIQFQNIEIYNLYEMSELGSEKCGKYWIGNYHLFKGRGHFLSSPPYVIGYSGNYLHGIYADWSTISINNIKMYNLYSTTGIVRGIGSYTSMGISFAGDIQFHDFHAGTGLYSLNTSLLDHPYFPAVAHPFFFLPLYTYSTTSADKTWESVYQFDGDLLTMNEGEVQSKAVVYCVKGRDGVGIGFDASEYTLKENVKCDETFENAAHYHVAQQIHFLLNKNMKNVVKSENESGSSVHTNDQSFSDAFSKSGNWWILLLICISFGSLAAFGINKCHDFSHIFKQRGNDYYGYGMPHN